ncbi:MAG: DNA-3-methyladenine glycosylase I [Actinobacteria bacterium]|nr:DNA-3-methyladenine glycosylase I [Actinomycetota bacterium]
MSTGVVAGTDGITRCPWCVSSPDYMEYHDREWGRPVRGDAAIFERISLEAFQSGLSWLTILRKRPAFRSAFAGFAPESIAAFGPADIGRLMDDAGIVRNHRKIEATISNAQAVVRLLDREGEGGLDALFWSFKPSVDHGRPATLADVPAATKASADLSAALKSIGLAWVGPTTMYAAMQACGLVDDHLIGCMAAVD